MAGWLAAGSPTEARDHIMPEFGAARRILLEAVGQAFPAAVVEVGRLDGVVWQEAFGRLTYEADAAEATLDTVFDLASLTKVIVTTTLAMWPPRTGGLMCWTWLAGGCPSGVATTGPGDCT